MSSWSFQRSRGIEVVHREREVQVRLNTVDLICLVSCSLGALVCVGPARWAPGALHNAALFAFMAVGPLVLRTLEAMYPGRRGITVLADFWLLPVAVLTHSWLSPIVDALNPLLKDAQLVAADQRLFGFQAAVELARLVPPWLNDILMVCYYGHFVWPLVLGIALYRRSRGPSSDFEECLTGMGLLFFLTYAAYAMVPAVGPRYFLIGSFDGPLKGAVLTPLLDSVMRTPLYARDCFPSGHTGTTLLVLFYAWRFARRLFWVMLLPGIGLIIATLAGRFHYATDLVAAVPLVMVVAGLALGLSRAARQREVVKGARSVPVDAIVRP
ncbi:phosphatase PAP2 family protein [Pyxidicoccus xibeiensis]|uniref:phosphatase PAP2 family protein n=1 Tax=Pyxidicoccus xibeiensis TaxID=2906759 RepID=UPI0020A74261|nr:phosphatase PAP2 family protein [Pyxidicoccus xibeiensis]MCP3142202.1 phosphatase PAP2 family protein [Pyxidicoccus xibeiensis]